MFMVLPFIALAVVVILVALFIIFGAKRKSQGKDLGEPGKKL
jgi:uncharacterized membrane protein